MSNYVVYFSMQFLSKIMFRGGLPYEFMKLEILTITTNFGKAEIPGVAFLFKSSPPTVHTLNIRMCWKDSVNDVSFPILMLLIIFYQL